MGGPQERPCAVNVGPFVGVDSNLWPTVYSRYRADTDVKWIKPNHWWLSQCRCWTPVPINVGHTGRYCHWLLITTGNYHRSFIRWSKSHCRFCRCCLLSFLIWLEILHKWLTNGPDAEDFMPIVFNVFINSLMFLVKKTLNSYFNTLEIRDNSSNQWTFSDCRWSKFFRRSSVLRI